MSICDMKRLIETRIPMTERYGLRLYAMHSRSEDETPAQFSSRSVQIDD